jgi:hypothetical protein
MIEKGGREERRDRQRQGKKARNGMKRTETDRDR